MKVLVTGGRSFSNRECVYDTLDWFARENGIDQLIHGACPSGADKMADDWAAWRKIESKPYPADWENIKHPNAIVRVNSKGYKYDVSAGFRRNSHMLLSSQPDAAIVFPGGNGTKDMHQKLKKSGLYIWVVKGHGRIEVEGDFPVGSFL